MWVSAHGGHWREVCLLHLEAAAWHNGIPYKGIASIPTPGKARVVNHLWQLLVVALSTIGMSPYALTTLIQCTEHAICLTPAHHYTHL